MIKLSVTNLINSYHFFDRDFWLTYKTIEKLLDKDKFNQIKISLMKTKRIDKQIIEEIGQDVFEVEKSLLDVEWKNKATTAKEEGIAIHTQIKDLFTQDLKSIKTNFGIDTDLYQVQRSEEFLNCTSGIFPEFKIEIKLSEECYLIGIADLIIKNGKAITIIDWKNSDKIDFKSRYDVGKKKTKMMKYPLCKLMDVNGVHYQLQLSIYAKMLQILDPTLNIDTLKIIQIKNGKIKKEHCVEYLSDVVDNLLKWHVKHSVLKQKIKECKTINYEIY